jgi:hypothetical protein
MFEAWADALANYAPAKLSPLKYLQAVDGVMYETTT